MEKKEFFINAAEMIDIDGSKNIPTVLHYQKGKLPLIGSAALSATGRNRGRSSAVSFLKISWKTRRLWVGVCS